MATASELLQQLNQYASEGANAPKMIEDTIKKAYEGPVSSLIQRGGELREAYYPEFFNSASRYGTGAADISPQAALTAMISDSERLGSSYRNNLGLRDYYGTMVNDLVGKGMEGYKLGYGMLSDQYNRAFQAEEAEKARKHAARLAALARTPVPTNPTPNPDPNKPPVAVEDGKSFSQKVSNAAGDVGYFINRTLLGGGHNASTAERRRQQARELERLYLKGGTPAVPYGQPVRSSNSVGIR